MVTEIMSNEFGKASCPRDTSFKPVSQKMSVSKRRKAREKFLCFCDIVLSYTKYEQKKQQEQEEIRARSQLDSDGSAADSLSEESNSSSLFMDDDSDSQMFPSQHYKSSSNVKERVDGQLPTGDESSETVTCFCLKPFGGRPMIECSRCNTWIHLSCAKIRRTNIPDVYICQACKDAKTKKRKSGRMRLEKQRLDM